jgi:RNA polymerase sigma-70 factor (ECF subfamily)
MFIENILTAVIMTIISRFTSLMKAYDSLSDEELIELIKQNDNFAYTHLFERYAELLLRHAYRLLTNQTEAHDIIQDVFLSIWQKRDTIQITVSVSSYLYTSVRNRIFDYLAHQKVILRYAESINSFMVQGYNITDDAVRERELAVIIEREIDSLPPKMREIFILNKKQGLSYKQISELLKITDMTAKQQVYKALKILKPKIDSFLSAFPFL